MDDELAMIRQRRLEELQRNATPTTGAGPVEVDEASLASFVKQHRVALIDVWAAWCGPCRMMEPIVEELAHEWKGEVGVGKLDADQNYAVLMQYGIQGIPTFLFFKDGQLAARLVGSRPKRDFVDVATRLRGDSGGADDAFQ